MKSLKSFPFVFLFLFSCKGFLEVEPQNKYFQSNFYETENQVFEGLVAAYSPLKYSYVDGRWTSEIMLGDIRSDNANAGGDNTNFDQPGWQQIDDLKNDALTGETRTFWKKYFIGINKANQVLTNTKISSSVIDQYIAEAKFLRALYHFQLVRTFGPIPVITTLLDPSITSLKRNTLTEVYTQIEKDLTEAIPLLPLSYSSTFVGRATKGAAQALLGKAYLYWADLLNDDKALFDKAAVQFQAVIQSNQYSLVDDYKALFAFGAANTTESVFEIQYTNQVAADWNTPYPFINGNLIVQLCGIRGLCSNNALYNEGWGFMLPTSSLYNSFLSDDTYRRDAAIISEATLASGGCSVNLAVQNVTDYTGYWQIKYANYKQYTAPGGEINVLKDANQIFIRYADVLLMCAEALIRGNGAASEAQTYIDQVRERAKGPGNNAGSFTTAAQLMTAKGWTLLEVIWYERRAELACEGDRWFDLVRSGRATADIFDPTDPRNSAFNANSLYLSIPQRETDITTGGLTPYPDPSLFK
jgi:starch-binding outer membrane protein, SusD/RagB family